MKKRRALANAIVNISKTNLGLGCDAVFIGDVLYGPGGSCGPRRQNDYQLVVLHQGELDLRLDGRRIRVAAGEAILLEPRHREHFFFSRTGETRHSWCAVRPEAVPPGLRRQLHGAIARPARFGGRMTTLFEWAQDHGESPDPKLREGFLLHLALGLLCDFALAVEENRVGPGVAVAPALQKLGAFVRREFARPLTLGEMAREAGVSPQHLLKLCRTRGLPRPMQQLYARRLEVAAEWLARTGLSVGEIAERCGFVNPFHFSRRFRQAHGKSPQAWRKGAWGSALERKGSLKTNRSRE